MKRPFVYILSNKNNTVIYVGVTSNISKRLNEHKEHAVEGFTKKYNIDKLVWAEEHTDMESAIVREKRIKKWNREWKVRMIEEQNPKWEDLSEKVE